MYRELCYFSSDYEEEIRSLGDPAKIVGMTKVVQFPYTQPVSTSQRERRGSIVSQDVVEKSDAELVAALERRREQGKRLQEMQAKQRAEKAGLSS